MNKVKIIRIGLIVLAVILVLFLFAKDLAIFGELNFKTNFKKFTPFISLLVPQDRVILYDFVYLKEEPVYFDIFLPRDFDQAVLEFEYQNALNSIIEVGMQNSETTWDLRPLENQILDNLQWSEIKDQGLTLWQKEKKYDSLEDFFNNLPDTKEIATYNYDLSHDYKIQGYSPANKNIEIDKEIDGNYQFITYIKDEQMYFEFYLASTGLDISSDLVDVAVYDKDNNYLASFYPENDKITVQMDDLPEGVYKLAFSVYDDIYTKKIITKQQYMSFVSNISLLDPAKLITNSTDLKFITYYEWGLQDLKIDDQKLSVNEIWQQFSQEVGSGLHNISIPEGEMSVTGNGLFALSDKQFFNPYIRKITKSIDFDKEGIKYVIAYYSLPQMKNDNKINSVEFDLSNAYIKDGKLRFVISIPGLTADSQGIVIKNLKVKLKRNSVFEEGINKSFYNYLKNYYKNEIK